MNNVILPARFNWRVPARIVLREAESANVFVDAWDPALPVPFSVRALPEEVALRLRAGDPFVVAEARVDLGADLPGDVVGEVTKILSVPSDEELGL